MRAVQFTPPEAHPRDPRSCLPPPALCSISRRLVEHLERLEIAIQELPRVIKTQPAGDHGRVDSAEIRSVDQVVAGVELVRLGIVAVLAAFTCLPATNIRLAAPWSVPRLTFSGTRRPNSEKIITTTSSARPIRSRSVRKAETASEA